MTGDLGAGGGQLVGHCAAVGAVQAAAQPGDDGSGGAGDDQGLAFRDAAEGLDLPSDSWPLARSPLMLETSQPGVFAVGDAREGSTKRVASAVGEGSVVIEQVHHLFDMGLSGVEA